MELEDPLSPGVLRRFDLRFQGEGRDFQMCIDLNLGVASVALDRPARGELQWGRDIEILAHQAVAALWVDGEGRACCVVTEGLRQPEQILPALDGLARLALVHL